MFELNSSLPSGLTDTIMTDKSSSYMLANPSPFPPLACVLGLLGDRRGQVGRGEVSGANIGVPAKPCVYCDQPDEQGEA